MASEENETLTINDLPDEVLEFILSLVPPYQDLHDCMRVCKRWKASVLNVVRKKRRQLHTALSTFNIQWKVVRPEITPTITRRYSHSAVVNKNFMYVFGGCTNSMTTFNDLWKLDLSTRQWSRPTAGGVYPTPKACSSLVCYNDSLFLFGGWTYPSSYPYHQSYQLFNDLHVYNIAQMKWTYVASCFPPPMAGHAATVIGNWMIVFGGIQNFSIGSSNRSNDVWKLNLDNLEWHKQQTTKEKPTERYGHSQMMINDENILIMGGCAGPNGLYNDVWILKMRGEIWKWRKLEVRNMEWAPANTWCHPACKVGNQVVLLNKNRNTENALSIKNHPPNHVWLQLQPRRSARALQDRDENVNGRRGTLSSRFQQPESSNNPSTSRGQVENISENVKIRESPRGLSLSAFSVSKPNRPQINKSREKQLERLRRMDNYMKNKHKQDETNIFHHPFKKLRKNTLQLYVLDISHVLDDDSYVSWLEPTNTDVNASAGPDDTKLYSLVKGKGELIMFGGVQKELENVDMLSANLDSTYLTNISNSLHFLSPPPDVI